jgi:hypothetical protein
MDLPDLEAEAKDKIDVTFYDQVLGGAESERTLVDNETAWSRFQLRPKLLRDVRTIDISTTMLVVIFAENLRRYLARERLVNRVDPSAS